MSCFSFKALFNGVTLTHPVAEPSLSHSVWPLGAVAPRDWNRLGAHPVCASQGLTTGPLLRMASQKESGSRKGCVPAGERNRGIASPSRKVVPGATHPSPPPVHLMPLAPRSWSAYDLQAHDSTAFYRPLVRSLVCSVKLLQRHGTHSTCVRV